MRDKVCQGDGAKIWYENAGARSGLHILAPRQSGEVFGEHICVEVDSLFIVCLPTADLPGVVFMFENTAYPTGLQCSAVNYILASSDFGECNP